MVDGLGCVVVVVYELFDLVEDVVVGVIEFEGDVGLGFKVE